ncbi:MAG: hypothetical protein QNK11_04115 [Legionella sp.]|nr:hypothetical protein [Legionella sp.]
MNKNYMPSLTHPSGQVLTAADWTAAGVHTASCDLAALLVKPGIKFLKNLDNIKQYWNWPDKLLLNTAGLLPNKSGMIQIRSAFDGRKLNFTVEEITALIQQLKPDSDNSFKVNNAPSEDALNGVVYTSAPADKPRGVGSIQDISNTQNFSVLDQNCGCPACKADLTRAYFHHLYVHTPLLCHRWLVMHNQWMTHH